MEGPGCCRAVCAAWCQAWRGPAALLLRAWKLGVRKLPTPALLSEERYPCLAPAYSLENDLYCKMIFTIPFPVSTFASWLFVSCPFLPWLEPEIVQGLCGQPQIMHFDIGESSQMKYCREQAARWGKAGKEVMLDGVTEELVKHSGIKLPPAARVVILDLFLGCLWLFLSLGKLTLWYESKQCWRTKKKSSFWKVLVSDL